MGDANIELIQSLYAAFGRADVPAILGQLTPDVEWEAVGRPSDFPTFGKRSRRGDRVLRPGRRERGLRRLHTPQPARQREKVFVLGHADYAARKTGKPVSTDWAHVFTLRDGKVAGFREFADTAQVAEAYRG